MTSVVVYSSNSCVKCKIVKDYLKSNGIEFTENNISEDANARKFLMKQGIMAVPVTVINGETVVGVNMDKINGLLGL